MLDFYAYLQDLCAILRLIVVHCIAGFPCTLAGNPKLDASMLRMDVGKVVCDACDQDGVPMAFCSCWSSWSPRHAEMPTPHGQPGMLNKGGCWDRAPTTNSLLRTPHGPHRTPGTHFARYVVGMRPLTVPALRKVYVHLLHAGRLMQENVVLI